MLFRSAWHSIGLQAVKFRGAALQRDISEQVCDRSLELRLFPFNQVAPRWRRKPIRPGSSAAYNWIEFHPYPTIDDQAIYSARASVRQRNSSLRRQLHLAAAPAWLGLRGGRRSWRCSARGSGSAARPPNPDDHSTDASSSRPCRRRSGLAGQTRSTDL